MTSKNVERDLVSRLFSSTTHFVVVSQLPAAENAYLLPYRMRPILCVVRSFLLVLVDTALTFAILLRGTRCVRLLVMRTRSKRKSLILSSTELMKLPVVNRSLVSVVQSFLFRTTTKQQLSTSLLLNICSQAPVVTLLLHHVDLVASWTALELISCPDFCKNVSTLLVLILVAFSCRPSAVF